MKSLAAALMFLSVSTAFAGPAVEVFGTELPALAALPDGREIPGRIDTAWQEIERLLAVPAGPAPILYLYPFDPSIQPARLSELQAEAFATANPRQTAEQAKAMYRQILGLTYDVALFKEGDADRGRVIQVSPLSLFTNESLLSKGSGLYVTTHEMVHYALNRLHVDPKYHHCLMVEPRAGKEPLLLELLNFEIAKDWASEFLKRPMRGLNGYALDQMHCDAEASHWEKIDGPSFKAEVKKLAEQLPK